MKRPNPLLARLWSSAVVWSWAFNGLRLASGVLILPLLTQLPEADFGFYYVLLSLVALVPLLDLGFLTSIDRSISFAMGGAQEIRSHGMATHAASGEPNFPLLWKLMYTTRALYALLSLGVLVFLGAWGSYVTLIGVDQTSNPTQTWMAWALTLVSAVFEMYSGWWNVYLRGLNRVLLCSRILALAFAVKFILSCALLIGGAGLLSVPLASLVASSLQRFLSRRYSMQFLLAHPSPPVPRSEQLALLRVLWPNSWRVGVHFFGGYLTVNANTFLCLKMFGLSANAQYGLSVQLIGILQSMATVWISVKWPLAGQLLTRGELESLRRVVRSRVLLQLGCYVVMAALMIPLAPFLLQWISSGKSVLPLGWFLILTVNGLLEMSLMTWTTLISLGNRLPFLWTILASNVLSLVLVVTLACFTSVGVGALVICPLVAGSLFNYWYWPLDGIKMLRPSK